MADVEVPWGRTELPVHLPANWRLQQVAHTKFPVAPSDWEDRLAMALTKPVAGPSLRERLKAVSDGRVVMIVEDLTRHSPLGRILGVILKEIRHAGVADENLQIVVASGMHPPATEAEIRRKLGPDAEGVSHRMNPWHDEKSYVNVGRACGVEVQVDRVVVEADLRIVVSSVSPHLQAGFGGGYKMLFPGCGLQRNIRLLHRVGICRQGQGQLVGTSAENNPMRRVIDAAGALVDERHGSTFSVQYVLDGENLPTHVAAGDPVSTHRMVTKQCALACGVIPEAQADVVIANAHPRDHDLWQAFKCIPNTCWAVRPNGVVICLARCELGLNEMKQMWWPLSSTATRRLVRWLGPHNISSLMDRIVKQLAGDSQWFVRLASQLLERNWIYMVSPKLKADGVKFPGVAIFETVDQAIARAQKVLGDGPQRVVVYPEGGISYPCPASTARNHASTREAGAP
jgi:nickel-dependent lactate racemase